MLNTRSVFFLLLCGFDAFKWVRWFLDGSKDTEKGKDKVLQTSNNLPAQTEIRRTQNYGTHLEEEKKSK